MLSKLLIATLSLVLLGCAATDIRESGEPAQAHRFAFRDGGAAVYLVADLGKDTDRAPQTFMFVVPGSECRSMARYLPHYFDGLGGSGSVRIFILHKRHVEIGSDGEDCGQDFVAADHPSQWLADHGEFIDTQLALARANGHPPQRVIALGISEGGELVPQLARRDARITHLVILANGGMNPADTFRLQARRHDFVREAQELEAFCAAASDHAWAAGRSCRYWNETFALDHTGNLLALDIPILVAMGDRDRSVPPEALRFLVERFAAAGKTNLTALMLPGADHALTRNRASFLPQIWDAVGRWYLE